MNKKILLIGICMLFLLIPTVFATLNTGLLGYWQFDSDNPMMDELLLHNWTDDGTSSVSGIINQARNHTFADTDILNITNWDLSSNTSGTINLWYQVTPTITANGEPIFQYYNDGNNRMRILSVDNVAGFCGGKRRAIQFRIKDAGSWGNELCSDSSLTNNTYHMITVVSTGTNIYLYVDGTNQSTHIVDTDWWDDIGNGAELHTGAINSGASISYGTSVVDELGLWDRALTDSEITNLYNSGSGFSYPFPSENVLVNWTTPVYESAITQHKLTLQNLNINSSTSANLTYNGTTYNGVINYSNSSFVEFFVNVSVPLIYTNNSANSFTWDFSLNGTTSNTSSSYNQYVLWNLTNTPRVNITAINLVSGGGINTFSINDSSNTISTTSGFLYFNKSSTGQYDLTIDASGFAISTESINFTAGILNTHQFSLYTTNSYNLTFYEEHTNTIIDYSNITVELFGESLDYKYNTSNGTLYIDLLSPQNYTIRYSATGFGNKRHYYMELTNRTANNLTLYLLNNTYVDKNLTTVVYNQLTLEVLDSSMIYIQRRYDNNTYITVAMYEADLAGKGYFEVEGETYYKFLVDYPFGTLKLTSEETYISSDVINLYVDIYDDLGEEYFDESSMSYSLTYDSLNNEFDVSYTDIEAVGTNYCLYLKTYGTYSSTTINSTCSTSNSASLSVGGLTQNKTYYAVFTTTINSNERTVASSWKENISDELPAGTFGLFMAAVIVMIMVFLSYFHILSLIFGSCGLLFAKMLGLISVAWPTLIGIVIVALVVAMIIQMKK